MYDINDTLVNNLPNDGGASGWRYVEPSALTNLGDFSSWDLIRPSNSAWNASQGMGRIYTNTDVQSNRVLRRGGAFDDTSHAGAFAMYLNLSATDASYGVGFRCAR
jgi:hypothetical protein